MTFMVQDHVWTETKSDEKADEQTEDTNDPGMSFAYRQCLGYSDFYYIIFTVCGRHGILVMSFALHLVTIHGLGVF